MDRPDDLEPKPPAEEPRRPSTPSPYMSPRLREKLEAEGRGGGDDDDFEIPEGRSPVLWIVIAVVVIAGIVGFLIFRPKGHKTEVAAADSTATAPADTTATATDTMGMDTTSTAAATPPTARPTSTPPANTSTTRPASTGATSTPATGTASTGTRVGADAKPRATPAEAPSSSRFGIAVGTFLSEDRAKEEQDKLKTATGLESRIVTVQDAGESSYRVVLGSFASRAAAERKAAELSGAGTVREARVVPIK